MPTILVVDDNPAIGKALTVLFSLKDLSTVVALSPEEGLELLLSGGVDLAICDLNFRKDTTSGAEGAELFARIRDIDPNLPVILLTAWTNLAAAVTLVKAGAVDYLAKPWDDQKLLTTVSNLLRLGEANNTLHRIEMAQKQRSGALASRFDLRGLIFRDPLTEAAVTLACQVARSDISVLITGPNGSGKERFAEILQANSTVKSGPFVTLNCGAIPSDLIEAELFGAEAGAYTSATKSREGKFEAADGGTLFLDEIGNLSLQGQMKLLRVLETGRFERLGSNKERQVSVRLLSATNADLPSMIRAGKFREDLYYRINGIEIAVPALTQRPEDIEPLAQAFLGEAHALHPDAVKALKRHSWPGNVRELKNAMARAKLLATQKEVSIANLGLPVVAAAVSSDELSRDVVQSALAQCGGVVAQAAQSLGVSRQALYRRMERLGIERD